MKKNILGIQANFLNPDGVTNESSVSFVKDGELRTCIAEERLSHKKLEGKFPALAINEVLERENITIDDIDTIAVPFLHPTKTNANYLKSAATAYADTGVLLSEKAKGFVLDGIPSTII